MKTNIWIYGLLLLFLATGCEKEIDNEPYTDETDVTVRENDNMDDDQVPEGYFVAKFSPSTSSTTTRAAITGQDSRVQHVHYIVYKSTGEFVKEKVLLSTPGSTSWPLAAVKDTLPIGSYKAVFLGNVEKTLFPYDTQAETGLYNDILLNYQMSYDDARIELPPAEFSNNTEYYWANVEFSDTDPNPYVLLQRIIGSVEMKRELINAQDALDMLVDNIMAQVNAGDIIQNTVDAVLTDSLVAVLEPVFDDIFAVLDPLNLSIDIPIIGERGVLDGLLNTLAGILDGIINPISKALVVPLTNALNEWVLQELVSQLGTVLTGNADKNALLEYLGSILNPWNNALAHSVVISIDNYPKAIDFGLNTKDIYEGTQNFQLGFTGDISESRFITLKNFAGSYDIGEIKVAGVGLVSGLVVDGVVDDFLLKGSLVDINDPLQITDSEANRRYMSSYSLLDLNTKQSVDDSESNLTLTVKLGEVLNLDDVLGGVLGGILDPVMELLGTVVDLLDNPLIGAIPIVGEAPGIINGLTGSLQTNIIDGLKELRITIELPINVSLLGIDNLALTGSWSEPVPILD